MESGDPVGQAVKGEGDLRSGEPGAQTEVLARPEGQRGVRQRGEEVFEGVAGEDGRVSVGGEAVHGGEFTGADPHATDVGVLGDDEGVAGAFLAVAEGDEMDQPVGQEGGCLFVRADPGPGLRTFDTPRATAGGMV